jgi:hypothetical protein
MPSLETPELELRSAKNTPRGPFHGYFADTTRGGRRMCPCVATPVRKARDGAPAQEPARPFIAGLLGLSAMGPAPLCKAETLDGISGEAGGGCACSRKRWEWRGEAVAAEHSAMNQGKAGSTVLLCDGANQPDHALSRSRTRVCGGGTIGSVSSQGDEARNPVPIPAASLPLSCGTPPRRSA